MAIEAHENATAAHAVVSRDFMGYNGGTDFQEGPVAKGNTRISEGSKQMRSFRCPDELWEDVAKAAEEVGSDRSKWIIQAIEEKMARQKEELQVLEDVLNKLSPEERRVLEQRLGHKPSAPVERKDRAKK